MNDNNDNNINNIIINNSDLPPLDPSKINTLPSELLDNIISNQYFRVFMASFCAFVTQSKDYTKILESMRDKKTSLKYLGMYYDYISGEII